jgi:phosphatidate cytidylyltransferase
VLRARLATAAVAIPLLLVLIFAAPAWLFAAFVSLIAFGGVVEFMLMAFPAQPRDRIFGIVAGGLLVVGFSNGPGLWAFAALVTVIGCVLVWSYLGHDDYERGFADASLTLSGVLYVALLSHFIWLRQLEDGPVWVTLVIATAMAGDTCGYFVGHAFGRHKLAPRVSPGKTIEGAAGIVIGSVVALLVGSALLLNGSRWKEAIALGAALALLEQLGDLTESTMKRTFGAKESGWIFPGHGGVLDRIDSLLFPVGFVYYYLALSR